MSFFIRFYKGKWLSKTKLEFFDFDEKLLKLQKHEFLQFLVLQNTFQNTPGVANQSQKNVIFIDFYEGKWPPKTHLEFEFLQK